MTLFLLTGAAFFNFCFYIFAIGFVIALILEQFVKDDERSLFIVRTNRRFCWQQAWLVNIFWFIIYFILTIMMRTPANQMPDMIWQGGL
tara:strand:+ start:215 stop:481 length:267 start_codon:yes stop_codon:yes gene_type:complete